MDVGRKTALRSGFIGALWAVASIAPAAAGIDLSPQFRDEVRCQVDDSFCHIHASTDLAEAACFRRTGKKLVLSESMMLLGHYIDMIATEKREAVQNLAFGPGLAMGYAKFFDRKTTRPPRERSADGLGVDDWDQGSSIENLARLNRGYICAENEFQNWFQFDREMGFFRDIMSVTAPQMGWFSGASSESELQRRFRYHAPALLECFISDRLGFRCAAEARTGPWTRDRDVESCLKEDFKVSGRDYDRVFARSLLERGVPFICVAGAEYDAETRELLRLEPSIRGHALVVVGVSDSGEWIVRDSYSGRKTPVKGDCRQMTWVE